MADARRLSRRRLLALTAGASGALLVPVWADELDPRVADIVGRNIAVDMHSHVPMTFMRPGSPASGIVSAASIAGEMKHAGFSGLCHTYAVDHLKDAVAGEYYTYHVQAMDQEDRLVAQAGLRRSLTAAEVRDAHGRGVAALIPTCEGAQFLEGRLDRVEEAYRRGLRMMQMVHQENDMVSPLGDIQTRPPNEFGGLTPFGAQVVKECNRLHILLDLAHAGFGMVQGVLKVTTQPIVISHTAVDTSLGRFGQSENMRQRLVSREHARAVVDGGGMVGVWKNFTTLKEFVTAIKEMADVVGIDRVGIGTDTYISSAVTGGPAVAGARHSTNDVWPDEPGGFVYKAANEMLRQGLTPAEIAGVIGENFCRVFGRVVAG